MCLSGKVILKVNSCKNTIEFFSNKFFFLTFEDGITRKIRKILHVKSYYIMESQAKYKFYLL